MSNANYQIYDFPDSNWLVVCGDIHGDFDSLVNKLCVQYQMTDTTCIVAGDCGFGFNQEGYYNNLLLQRNNKRMKKANNRIVFVRGNHDNPAYFDGNIFAHKRFVAIPDYSVVKVTGHCVLCIGGAISIDRRYRQKQQKSYENDMKRFGHHFDESNPLRPNLYWEDEAPVFKESLLNQIVSDNRIDTVVTHTAPSFCEVTSKTGLEDWARIDTTLLRDVDEEQLTMDRIYDKLKGLPITHWCYGHFHQSWHAFIEGTLFKMLDIMELYEVRPR
ncbi:MAG: metallophosphoesterase [Paludibacteraceae bacterium]|nr:metallophosphoesterase [Paludibacteraceae bacterium]